MKILRPTLLTLMTGYLIGCEPPFSTARNNDPLTNSKCKNFHYVSAEQRKLGGVYCPALKSGKENKVNTIVFLHGAPGNWKAWKRYLDDTDLSGSYNLVAVNRPGYDTSENGKPEISLAVQSRLIREAVQTQIGPEKRYIVVGHSFGGPVAVQMAIDDKKSIAGLLLLAPSIDPDLEKIMWYQRLANFCAVRWILPSEIDVTNREIIPLKSQLEQQKDKLKTIDLPVIVLQGDQDGLVPPKNADYAKRMMTNAKTDIVMLEGRNHFLPWLEYDLVKKKIVDLLQDL